MFFHKKPPHEPACLGIHIGASVLLLLSSLASLVGVIVAHYDPRDNSLVFGTVSASLALIAFAVSVSFLIKQCKSCMSSCDMCEMPAMKKKK